MTAARIRIAARCLRICTAVVIWYVLVLVDANNSATPITVDYAAAQVQP